MCIHNVHHANLAPPLKESAAVPGACTATQNPACFFLGCAAVFSRCDAHIVYLPNLTQFAVVFLPIAVFCAACNFFFSFMCCVSAIFFPSFPFPFFFSFLPDFSPSIINAVFYGFSSSLHNFLPSPSKNRPYFRVCRMCLVCQNLSLSFQLTTYLVPRETKKKKRELNSHTLIRRQVSARELHLLQESY